VASPLELLIVAGDAVHAHPLPAEGTISLGRGKDCDVCIDNGSVSRRHALLHVGHDGAELSLEDLGSANGTFVRDAKALADDQRTHPLRRLSRESLLLSVGEGVILGTATLVVRRAAAPDPARDAPGSIVHHDAAMRALYAQARRAAQGSISVLILGETGVGKEVLARFVHDSSPRASGPFLALNCAALAESLLESELFGHEKGAFTGAVSARPGLFESACGGTVFLDEVGELPAAVQVKLLRALEDRTVLRVGGRTPQRIDVRFVAATHRDLEARIAEGAFREDLYFRLNGVSFAIPPLRSRTAEVLPLAELFAGIAARQMDRRCPLFSPEAVRLLERWAWPGNVRELRNVVERAVVMHEGTAILPEDLPARMSAPPASVAPKPTLPGELAAIERRRIVEALEKCAGNQTQAAELLGMPRRTLVARLSEYGIPRPRKRGAS
jgi:DNA-binding NtrC family response regulator